MKLYYDLHIHSALSPCGDFDMTPNNIVNMAHLKGLDVVAVTDHNSAANVRSVMDAAKGKLYIVPGIEITTSEEVHVLCYFDTLDALEDMARLVKKHLPRIKNRADIFGEQLIFDEYDNVIGREDALLINATELDIYRVQKETMERGGIFVPAHIDKSSYSIISNLGFLPPDLHIDGLEISSRASAEFKKDYSQYEVFTSSDAHYLENIAERERFLCRDGKITKKLLENLYKI